MSAESPRTIEVGPWAVSPGQTKQFRYEVVTTYHGNTVEIQVSFVNGDSPDPAVFLTAAVHGDDLNGIKVIHHGGCPQRLGG